jgi:hypothetical protein
MGGLKFVKISMSILCAIQCSTGSQHYEKEFNKILYIRLFCETPFIYYTQVQGTLPTSQMTECWQFCDCCLGESVSPHVSCVSPHLSF